MPAHPRQSAWPDWPGDALDMLERLREDPGGRTLGQLLQERQWAVQLSGNVRQPNHVLANEIAGHKAERRPGAGEEWLAATKHDGAEIESILINKAKVG